MSSPSRDDPSSTKRSTTKSLQVLVENLQEHIDIDVARWERLAEITLEQVGVARGELSISFVDVPTITELNETHMEAFGPTDVLSFPMDASDFIFRDNAESSNREMEFSLDAPLLLGDVIIAPEIAQQNAAEHARGEIQNHPGFPHHRGTLEDELALLVVHGILHLLGHDHYEVNETARMHEAERSVLELYVSDHFHEEPK